MIRIHQVHMKHGHWYKSCCWTMHLFKPLRIESVNPQMNDFPPVTQVLCLHAKSQQSCLTLWNPMDCRLPIPFVHRILQAKILEWVAMPSSRGIFLTQGSNPHLLCLLHWQVGSLWSSPIFTQMQFRTTQWKTLEATW